MKKRLYNATIYLSQLNWQNIYQIYFWNGDLLTWKCSFDVEDDDEHKASSRSMQVCTIRQVLRAEISRQSNIEKRPDFVICQDRGNCFDVGWYVGYFRTTNLLRVCAWLKRMNSFCYRVCLTYPTKWNTRLITALILPERSDKPLYTVKWVFLLMRIPSDFCHQHGLGRLSHSTPRLPRSLVYLAKK